MRKTLPLFFILCIGVSWGTVDLNITAGSGSMSSGDEYRVVSVYNSALFDVSGGIADSIFSYNTSTVDLSGGDIDTLVSFNLSTVTISGGSYTAIQATANSTIYLYRTDNDPTLTYTDNGTIHIYGHNVQFTRAGGNAESGWLSGSWTVGGESFYLYLRNLPESFDSSNIVIHEMPEPATLILIASGLLFVKRTTK